MFAKLAERVVPLAMFVAAAAIGHAEAAACSIQSCGGAAAAPGDREFIPWGAAALAHRPGGAGGPVMSLPDIRLLRLDGVAVGFTATPDPVVPNYLLLRPTTPLASGIYRLVDYGRC